MQMPFCVTSFAVIIYFPHILLMFACPSHQQCEGGYFCFQRDEDEDVPGCNGDAEDGIDYCIPEFYRDN